MKSVALLTTLLLGLCASSHGAVYNFVGTTPNGGVVPDGNLSGWSSSLTSSGFIGNTFNVQINLHITGGYNGDLYAYLSHDGVLVPLLTRLRTRFVVIVPAEAAPVVGMPPGGSATSPRRPNRS